jgi:hypothetical protein
LQVWLGLGAGEKDAADDLRVGFEEAEAAAVAILREYSLGRGLGMRCRTRRCGRRGSVGTHERVFNVVADAGEGAAADEVAFADLCAVATDCCVVWVGLGQAHFGPDFESRAANAVASGDEVLVGAGVVEEIELDQFDALEFEVEEGAG